ncbi:hypothetical protein SAMN04488498_104341 [Mesorhizobium albiziae]|uniref:Uncharacterized protein n=1 Tax=Neomesorhizobium albiziae TaxID=335020 RepID=A0A1I3YCJ4_9HYPH|nr:hypothetical protein [Mesorhizobium albiziae]GLS29954.1 hypothetical protein GCM10007937_16620 [Mesorhizobium albiziae]SFK29463.1 hypothetical protein SAMN04488498_104341 [Mesorhizobium albiziae]
MLAAEAARLAALEVLCPKSALDADGPYPTLAGHKVFDSRLVGIDDLDPTAKFTPVLALFTADSAAVMRGEAASFDDAEATSTLEIIAELAVASTDEAGEPFADAMPADDWDARLVLAALCGQVRRLLQYDERGWLFRRFVRRVVRVTEETFAIPQLGARWHRVTMRFELSLPDDVFVDAAGMPEPLKTLAALLPSGSPARNKLTVLAAHFNAVTRTPLAGVDFADPALDVGLTANME